MADLHKALTSLREHYANEAEYGHGAWREPCERFVERLDDLLAEHPPTAPVVDREALVDVLVMTPMADGHGAMSTFYRTADAIIAFLDGGDGS